MTSEVTLMRSLRFKMIRVFLLSALLLFCALGLPAQEIFAAKVVVLSAECEKSIAGQGDLVRIDIKADNFPGVVSFGPLVVKFDPDKAEFFRLQESDVLTTFVYTSTQTDDTVTISAVDQMVSFGEDAEDNAIEPFASDDEVVLYSLYFRILPSATETADFKIESSGDFINEKQKKVKTEVASGTTLIVNQSTSSDATLTFLDLGSVAITPEFDPHITEYEAMVERSVTDVEINATSSNIWAAVFINGNRNLVVGENHVEVNVTAQDGQTHMRYRINITRKESYVPENAVLVDGEGTLYNFVDPPQEYNLPEGFTQTTRSLNGFSVPAFVKEGIISVIVYLYDGVNQPGFYFYNYNTKTVTPYVEGGTVVRTGQVYTNISGTDGVVVPDGFSESEYEEEDQVIKGYKNSAGDFICYLVDEQGHGMFYQYDTENGSFYKYIKPDEAREIMYRFLFTISFIAAVTEAVIIIIIVTLVRKLIADKSTPRPKRV